MSSSTPAYRPTIFASGLNCPSNARPWILAGAPIGTVAGELSARMRAEVSLYTSRGGRVFVDSGAFPAFRKGSEVDFDQVFETYLELASSTDRPANLYLVAPDIVGDQDATFALLAQYSGELAQLADLGVTLLVPIQKGALSIVEAYDRTEEILPVEVRRREWIVALPFNAHAWTSADAIDLATGTAHGRIHLLGGGIAKVAKVAIAVGDPLETECSEIQGDACRLVAMRGSYAVKSGRNFRSSDRLVLGIDEGHPNANDGGDDWDEGADPADSLWLRRDSFQEALWMLACEESGDPALAVAPWECATFQPALVAPAAPEAVEVEEAAPVVPSAPRSGWAAYGRKGSRRYLHASGVQILHCGHGTALRPYCVEDPLGNWVGAMDDQTRNGRPVGLVFRRLAEAKSWVESHLWPTVALDVETLAIARSWSWRLPADWGDLHSWPILNPEEEPEPCPTESTDRTTRSPILA